MPKKPTKAEEKAEFEEFVGALLQVDPSGLSGKHRKADDDGQDEKKHPPKN